MANPVRTKLQKISGQYSAKVKEIRELKESLRKPFVTDAEAKVINTKIRELDAERLTLNTELNKLGKLEKTAEEYLNLNKKIKEIDATIAKANARGEDTAAFTEQKNKALGRLNQISTSVETAFPEIKVAKPSTVAPAARENLKGDKGIIAQEAAAKGTVIAGTPAQVTGNAVKPPVVKKPPVIKKPPIAGEVVDKPKDVTGKKTATGAEDINAIYELARSQYGNVDSIFLYDPELKELLIEAVGDPTTTVGDMKPAEFARRLAATDWAIRNATSYAKRDAERRQYTETLDKYNQQLQLADTQEKKDVILSKIGQLNTTSTYARGLASAKAYIEATASGLTGTMSPERLDAFVKRMYDSGNDKDPNIINRELAALVSYKPGMQLGGSVGGDLTTLRATAAANGFDLDTSFGSSINDWLQRLAKGESIETFKNTIRGAAKLGLPDKVSNLLDQGLDLKDIYSPYKKVMASVLEVSPDSISLDDKTLRMAIGPEKEMSIYDFQRMLRKDARWQYTNNAREEASDSVLKVLKDFGFQG
jgi:hypothetical protein